MSAITLRLFDGTAARAIEASPRSRKRANGNQAGQAPPLISEESTLGEFYRLAFVPRYLEFKGLRPGTRKVYDNAIAWWERLTPDPPLWAIEDETIDLFLMELAKQPGRCGERLSPATVHQVARSLDTILQVTGPRSRRNKRGQGILSNPPFFEKPELARKAIKPRYSVEQLAAMYQAADMMKIPRRYRTRIKPAGFWRLTLSLFYFTGFRREEALAVTWADVHERDGERVIVLPAAIRKGRVEEHAKWIHPDLADLLTFAQGAAKFDVRYPETPILPWPHDERHLERSFKRLGKLAGVRNEKDRDLCFHAIRRTHLNLFYRSRYVALRDQALAEASASAGHADVATTVGHYVEEDPIEVALQLKPAILGLPGIAIRAVDAARPH